MIRTLALDKNYFTFNHIDEPIEEPEIEYVGIILEDRTVIIDESSIDEDLERTLSKVNDKKVVGFVHGLDDDEVPDDEILDAFDRGFKTYEEYIDYLMYLAEDWKEAGNN